MKKYRLKEDLPTFKAGDEFELRDNGNLYLIDKPLVSGHWRTQVCAYCKTTLDKFPNILTDWFEEIPEQPKTVWDLEIDDKYWTIDENGYIGVFRWDDYTFEKECREAGNVFLTKKEAEKELARRKAKVILERDTKGFRPDWEKENDQDKYSVYFNYLENELMVWREDYGDCGLIYFRSYKDAKASIKTHEKEWMVYLNVED